ncbi:MAG: DUF4290 domain-containing protein [Bacteroidia bacterium]|nr:DUF4290 domain-containing protein [Bacteroidia bacterium]
MIKEATLEYNTERSKLILSEYGRSIQKMVDYATQIEDVEKRKKVADEILTLMGQLNPHLRDIADYKHKLYDHLFIISDFKLDLESPYPKPTPETVFVKPEAMKYPQSKISYRFYGKNIQNMINKVTELPEGAFKTSYINAIGSFMKTNCRNWNDEVIGDEQIMAHLAQLSDGKIIINDAGEIDFKAQQMRRMNNNQNNNPNQRNSNNRNFRNNSNSNNNNHRNNNNNNRKPNNNNPNNKNPTLGSNDSGYRKFNSKDR